MAMSPPPPPPIALLFLISSLVATTLLLPASAAAEEHRFVTTTSARKSTAMKPKLSHLHFYFHDVVSGRNPTAVPVAKPLPPASPAAPSSSFFGLVTMMDDPLTEGPEPGSKRVGYAQGMYSSASQTELAFLMAMNLYFTEGKYNGSALSVLGRNPPMQQVREMPVVGGSGLFRFARGYALAHTHWFDFKSGDAIVEYNVTVMHY